MKLQGIIPAVTLICVAACVSNSAYAQTDSGASNLEAARVELGLPSGSSLPPAVRGELALPGQAQAEGGPPSGLQQASEPSGVQNIELETSVVFKVGPLWTLGDAQEEMPLSARGENAASAAAAATTDAATVSTNQ